MCQGCKYYKDGICEFLLLPESCDEFDLGDKFGKDPDCITVNSDDTHQKHDKEAQNNQNRQKKIKKIKEITLKKGGTFHGIHTRVII